MTQPGWQTIAIHLLPNISRSKVIEAMTFGQLEIFLEEFYPKCGGETIPRPFSKKSKLNVSLDQQPKVS